LLQTERQHLAGKCRYGDVTNFGSGSIKGEMTLSLRSNLNAIIVKVKIWFVTEKLITANNAFCVKIVAK